MSPTLLESPSLATRRATWLRRHHLRGAARRLALRCPLPLASRSARLGLGPARAPGPRRTATHQLATILRLSSAQQLGTAVLLDDQLAQSDPRSMGRFGDVLKCRPDDYLGGEEPAPGPSQGSMPNGSEGVVRVVDSSGSSIGLVALRRCRSRPSGRSARRLTQLARAQTSAIWYTLGTMTPLDLPQDAFPPPALDAGLKSSAGNWIPSQRSRDSTCIVRSCAARSISLSSAQDLLSLPIPTWFAERRATSRATESRWRRGSIVQLRLSAFPLWELTDN